MSGTNAPRNTSASDPLENFLVAVVPGGIEAQEAQGQREMVVSTVLPRPQFPEEKQTFEELGFVFGEPVAGDPLFQHAKLPDGWRKEPTEHSMWTKIVDDRGVDRVEIFYKAAFYDRDAFMRLTNVGSMFVYDYVSKTGLDDRPVWDSRYTDEEREQALAACERRVSDEWSRESERAAAAECRDMILAAEAP